jgi:protein translocase SecG subunit
MKNFLLIAQIIIACVLATLILIQSRGTGLGHSFGGGGSSFTRRGLEKLLYKLTFVFAGLFIVISIISLAV